MATRVIVDGPVAGQKFALDRHQLVLIGRDHDATFQVLDPRISRHHLQIKRLGDADTHAVIDFNSANGVQVNGSKIAAETPLSDGDVIRVGDSSIMYSGDDEPDAQRISQLLRKHGEGRCPTQLDTSHQPGD